ncbi:MAG: alpha/beta hydrolase [Burkholderiales bacterium]|nr:alpha/beta hydrolase [Burkholderiales bacterium]
MAKYLIALIFAWMPLLGSCTRLPDTGVTALKPKSVLGLQEHLLSHKPEVSQFRLRGPFTMTARADYELRLSPAERIETDLYLSSAPGKAPLVILLHGYGNSKEDHAYQALHLATWGMHSIALRLPNKGPWTRNGNTLARVVNAIAKRPELIDSRIDPKRIILAGHSFGGSSVAIALAGGVPAAGAILLDPAGVRKDLPAFLAKIRTPVMLLNSDARYTMTRDRTLFYKHIRGNVGEVSIANARHEDAQFPIDAALQAFAGTATPTEELQITFVSALTAAAISLASTGKLDYAWECYREAIRTGQLIEAHRK